MERSEITERFRGWYEQHTNGALTQHQRQFWIIFWLMAVLSVVLYYLLDRYVDPFLNGGSGHLLAYICVALPMLALRRLHVQAFFIIASGIVNVFIF